MRASSARLEEHVELFLDHCQLLAGSYQPPVDLQRRRSTSSRFMRPSLRPGPGPPDRSDPDPGRAAKTPAMAVRTVGSRTLPWRPRPARSQRRDDVDPGERVRLGSHGRHAASGLDRLGDLARTADGVRKGAEDHLDRLVPELLDRPWAAGRRALRAARRTRTSSRSSGKHRMESAIAPTSSSTGSRTRRNGPSSRPSAGERSARGVVQASRAAPASTSIPTIVKRAKFVQAAEAHLHRPEVNHGRAPGDEREHGSDRQHARRATTEASG